MRCIETQECILIFSIVHTHRTIRILIYFHFILFNYILTWKPLTADCQFQSLWEFAIKPYQILMRSFKTVFYILEIRNATLIRMLALTTVYVNSSREWPVINSIWRLEAWYNIHVMATINELNGDGKISVWWWNQIWLKCKV